MKERTRETTRAAILDAAERVYAAHGFQSGRMEQVAERAGVSVGTLYNYFADRRALVKSLLEERRAELLRRVDSALAQAPADPVARLRALLVSTLVHFEHHRAFVALLVQEGAGDSVLGSLASGPTATFLALRARVREALAAVRRQGTLREPDDEFLAYLLAGSVRATVLYELVEQRTLDPEATADRLLRLFLEGAGGA